MVQVSGLTRGDRRRNARIERLREVVAVNAAIVAIDLGERTQSVVVMDQTGRVWQRRVARVQVHELGPVLRWAVGVAGEKGASSVVVGCEPTGHRWRAVMALAELAGVGFVCVQPLQVHLARESDDYTRDKTDHKDAVLIGRLIARLDCYLPEPADVDWARLRHLGQRRSRLIIESVAAGKQIADLLGCCWPAALATAAKPMHTLTWWACVAVATEHTDGDLAAVQRMGRKRFVAKVTRAILGFGGQRPHGPIVQRFYAALADEAGLASQRRGGLERVGLLVEDRRALEQRRGEVEARMVAVLDARGLTELLTSIPGVSAVGAASILAETGDLGRFPSARSVVKHAGLNPIQNTSGAFRGRSRTSRRGRPGLRTAAWRLTRPAITHNPVLAARYAELTSRADNPLTPGAAQVACASTLLRWMHAIVVHATAWDPDIATGHRRRPDTATHAAA